MDEREEIFHSLQAAAHLLIAASYIVLTPVFEKETPSFTTRQVTDLISESGDMITLALNHILPPAPEGEESQPE